MVSWAPEYVRKKRSSFHAQTIHLTKRYLPCLILKLSFGASEMQSIQTLDLYKNQADKENYPKSFREGKMSWKDENSVFIVLSLFRYTMLDSQNHFIC